MDNHNIEANKELISDFISLTTKVINITREKFLKGHGREFLFDLEFCYVLYARLQVLDCLFDEEYRTGQALTTMGMENHLKPMESFRYVYLEIKALARDEIVPQIEDILDMLNSDRFHIVGGVFRDAMNDKLVALKDWYQDSFNL